MKFIKKIILTLCASLILNLINAQTTENKTIAPAEKENLKFNLNADGSHFFQATFLNQVWLRYNQSNAGTMVDGKAASETFDIGLRRTRMQLFGQITDKVFVYFQFGQNNFNSQYNYSATGGQRKQAAFFHDAVCEYKVSKKNQLKLGGGLTIVNGLSRFSQPGVANIMTMDVPVFAQATVDQTDQFSRKLSFYARGQVGKIDYRLAISDPFSIVTNGAAIPAAGPNSTFAALGHTKQYQAHIMWQFFEHESHLTPGYMAGTYLGKKKIFNISVGGISQKNAMWNRASITDSIKYQNLLLLCAESFLDMPLNKEKGTAINAYVGYFKNNYGKNYLRYNGIMNPATSNSASNAISGAGANYGNAFPMFGTGSVIYTQVGYLLNKSILKDQGQLMPYLSATLAKYDRLGNLQNNIFNAGINWLIKGHNAKLTLDLQNRPTYEIVAGQIKHAERKNALTMQYQIFF